MLTLLPSLADTINRQRLSLFGHVAHMDLGTPAHDALDCAMARRMEQHPPSGWKRPPGRPCCTWTQQIGNSSTSSVHHEWTHATARGHATRSALGSLIPKRSEGRKEVVYSRDGTGSSGSRVTGSPVQHFGPGRVGSRVSVQYT